TEGDQPQASGHFQRPANRPSGQSGEFPTVARPAGQFTDGPIGDQPQASGSFPHPNRGQSGQFPAGGAEQPRPTGQFPIPPGEQSAGRGRPPQPGSRSGQFPVAGQENAGDQSGQFRAQPGGQPQANGEGKPHIPRQQAPGQSSMPPRPDEPERAEPPVERIGLTPPPGVSPQELAGLTTEMEPIGEAVQKRRRVDQTLARFSKVHDELKAEEKARKSKRIKLSPWAAEDAELDEKLDELAQLPGTELVTPVAEDEPEKPKRSRWSLIAKVFSGSTALVVFAATAAGWGFKEWTENSIGQVHALDPDSADIKNAQAQLGDENFLLVGSDSREGAQAEDNIGDVSKIPGARSDTVMIAHIPADRSRVVIVSFPRDLEINRPACQRFDAKQVKYLDEQVAANKTAKMNTAYEVGGPLCLTRVVQEISGLHITRFVGIDFQGFKGMVDAVDGVNVCVEKPMYDTTLNKWVVQQAGTDVVLRGEQALDFVRARHVRGDPTSDYGRIKRQQRFLSSLLRKAMSGQVLLDPSKLTNFVSEMAKSTFGDNIQIDALMQLGQSLQNLAAGRVTFVTVPTVGIENSRHNEVLRRDDSNALFAAIINDQPLPGESAGAPTEGNQQAAPIRPQPEPVDPKTLKIQVLNGGNPTGGIAKRTADKLAEFGFTVVQSGIGPAVPKTVVRYGAGHEAAAQTLASAVPGAELQEDPSMSGALVLTIGPDFAGQVIAPGTGGANPNPTPPPAPLPENLSTVNGADVNCA
uniref:LCP family protein n=1 Tax=Actinokineospora enzanensis TaxID=155975 RepID=UPI000364F791